MLSQYFSFFHIKKTWDTKTITKWFQYKTINNFYCFTSTFLIKTGICLVFYCECMVVKDMMTLNSPTWSPCVDLCEAPVLSMLFHIGAKANPVKKANEIIMKIVLTLQTPWNSLRDPHGPTDHILRTTTTYKLWVHVTNTRKFNISLWLHHSQWITCL